MKRSIIVKTKSGSVCGHEVKSQETGGKFCSFLGIPYAKPPVGPLRFRPPEPVEPWSGVRDCHEEGNVCIQNHIYLRDLRGSEDCLYLNVYTPQLDLWGVLRLPVMVRFHGGGFTTGSGSRELSGPDFIVNERVILVTLNYRLSVFGFLCLEEPGDAQGNMGLKDQVAALKWVRENIENFGGDPKKVTIAGESAGGASVHLHMMSPMSRGLFSAAIAESGVAINPWALTNDARKRAFRLGERLGCKTNNSEELLKFLRSVPAEKLVKSASLAFSSEDKDYVYLVAPFPFVPSVEVTDGSVKAFLSENPMNILREGRFFKGPFLAGVNNREGMVHLAAMFGKDRKEMLSKFDRRISNLVPADLSMPRGSEEERKAAASMRRHYLKDRPVSEETLGEYVDLTGDLMFLYGFYTTMKHHCKFTAPYLYEFSYEGAFNVFKNILGEERMSGACHADELGYLFKMDLLPSKENLPSGTQAVVVRDKVVKLWTNFVKTGNPTPKSQEPKSVTWHPSRHDSMTYLQIGSVLENKKGAIAENRMLFWDNMYSQKTKLKNKL